ncbi:MAG: isochorismate synthase [Anaerolineae bacterium]
MIKINGTSYHYERLERSISPLDLLAWIDKQTLFPKFYWKGRDDAIERVALGKALAFEHIPEIQACSHRDLRCFGALGTMGKSCEDPLWSSFSSCCCCYFFFPSLEIIQDGQEAKIIAHFFNQKSDPKIFESIAFDFEFDLKKSTFKTSSLSSRKIPNILSQNKIPDFEKWQEMTDAAKCQIQRQEFQKIVLARRSSFKMVEELSGFYLLKTLKERGDSVSYFAFQTHPQALFLGASPEKLYSRSGSFIASEALAGTRRRGVDVFEDRLLQEELKNSAKEKEEFSLVAQYIKEALHPLCKKLEPDGAISILQTGSVQHLYRRFIGELKEDVTDRALIEALHPTPAVGGMPRREALAAIESLELFQRGLYAGIVGWMTSQKADFAVAIRSALCRGDELHLFAGAGIVKDSDAAKEWEELEHKIAHFQKIFMER